MCKRELCEHTILYASVIKVGLTPSVMPMLMNVISCHLVVKIMGPASTQRVASTALVHLGFQGPLVVRTAEIHAQECHARMGIAPNSVAPHTSAYVIQTTQECWNVQ